MRIAQVSKTSETTPALAPYLIILAQYNSPFCLLTRWGGSKDVYSRMGFMHLFHVLSILFCKECLALVYNNCVESRFNFF